MHILDSKCENGKKKRQNSVFFSITAKKFQNPWQSSQQNILNYKTTRVSLLIFHISLMKNAFCCDKFIAKTVVNCVWYRASPTFSTSNISTGIGRPLKIHHKMKIKTHKWYNEHSLTMDYLFKTVTSDLHWLFQIKWYYYSFVCLNKMHGNFISCTKNYEYFSLPTIKYTGMYSYFFSVLSLDLSLSLTCSLWAAVTWNVFSF